MSRVDHPGRKWSALVVDDDPGVQGLLLALLGHDGFAVDCAPTGREAYEYLKRRSYSVILLDLLMPDVDGFELLELLARENPASLRRVIVMTGATENVEHPVFALFRKPFEVAELAASARACAGAG